jgi:mannosyltransferase OCH1-like enzyme
MYYPQEWEYFNLIARPVMKIDLFRLMVVATFGGVWADIDTRCFWPLQEWYRNHKGARIIVGIEAYQSAPDWSKWLARPLQINQWTFASVPQHPLLLEMINSVFITMKSIPLRNGKIDVDDKLGVLDFSGPGMFTDHVFAYLKQRGHGWWRNWKLITDDVLLDDVLLLPQIRLGSQEENWKQGMYVIHKFQGSWRTGDYLINN